MKCIQCGTDNTLRDRTRNYGRCKQCNHQFVFEPQKTMDSELRFTDLFFGKALNDISANNTLYFTLRQFHYLLDRRLKRKAPGNIFKLGCLMPVGVFGCSLFITVFFWFLLSVLLSVFSVPIPESIFDLLVFVGWYFLYICYLFTLSNSPKSDRRTRRSSATVLQIWGTFIFIVGIILIYDEYNYYYSKPNLTYAHPDAWLVIATVTGLLTFLLGFFQKRRITKIPETFLINTEQMRKWMAGWVNVNGSPEKLLSSPSDLSSDTPNNVPNPDVTAYSFERLVVCDNIAIAQMLIANNFHFENNCAVVTISGYPQNIFHTIIEMVRRNPELQVFALHDCNPRGMELVHELRTNPHWFPDSNIPIVDIGLLPRQILAAKRDIFVQTSITSARNAENLDPHIRQNLSEKELKWLDEGNFVELEFFTPRKLIQILNKGIATSKQMDIVEDDTSTFVGVGNDSGYFYTTESFG